jgi:DNA modification methylase
VLDPFMGTGTTAIAVEKYETENEFTDLVCIGCELSEKQVEFSRNRLELFRTTGKTNFKEKDVKAIGGEAEEEDDEDG